MTHTVESLMALAHDWLSAHENDQMSAKTTWAKRDTFRDSLREALRGEYLRGIDAAAKAIAPKYAAAPIVGVGQTYSGSIASCGCSTYTDSAGNVHAMQCYMHAILALKEQP
jgi:hypothetical protein